MLGKDLLIRIRDGLKFALKGSVANVSDLPATGNIEGDAYLVDGSFYVWYKDKWEYGGKSEGAPGVAGTDGSNGITPKVGSNENWWYGDQDSGFPSRGASGPIGERGPTGLPGKDGEPGVDGEPGKAGANGKSAYEIAKDNGFTGTEQEWLESMKGGLTEQEVKRVISQSKSEVMSAWNAINPNVQISTNTVETQTGAGLTAKASWIETSSIINTRGSSYAKLYFGSSKANFTPQIDASGSAIRIKRNENAMLRINTDSHSMIVDKNGSEKTLYTCYDGLHSWNTGSTGMRLETDNYWCLRPSTNGNMDLGINDYKWRNVFANSTSGVSDKRDKENIDYVDMSKRREEFLSFFKAYKPVTYQWKSRDENDNHQEFGFIAQDVIYSDIGKLFVNDYGDRLGFSYNSYFGVICAGLQSEINKREDNNKLLSDRISVLESKLSELLKTRGDI